MNRFIFIFLLTCICFFGSSKNYSIGNNLSGGYRDLEFRYSFFEGIRNKYLQNFKSSAAAFQNAILQNDSSAAAYYELANLFILAGNYKVAQEYSFKALQFDSLNKWYQLQYIRILLGLKKYNECKSFFVNYIQKNPDDINIYLLLAELYQMNKKYDSALIILNKLPSYFQFSNKVIDSYITIYSNLKNIDKVIFYIKTLSELIPDDQEYYIILANAYDILGDTLSLHPNFLQIMQEDHSKSFNTYLTTNRFLKTRQFDSLILFIPEFFHNPYILFEHKLALYEKLTNENVFLNKYNIELDSVFLNFTKSQSNYQPLTIYIDFLIRVKSYQKAISPLKSIISATSPNPVFYQQLINLYSLTDKYDSAFLLAKESIKSFPSNPNFYLLAGIAAYQLEKLDTAIQYFQDGIKKVSYSTYSLLTDFYSYLGDIYYQIKNPDKSFYYYEEALKIDSSDLIILNNFAYYLSLEKKNLERAKKMSYYTISKDSLNATFLDTYAWVLFHLKDYKEALHYIELAIKFSNNHNAEVLEHYADILVKVKQKEKAKFYYELAIKNGGDVKRINSKMRRLRFIR